MKKNNFSCVKIQSDNDHHSTLNLPVTTTIQNLFFFSFHGTKRPSAFRSNLRRMRIQTARAGTHVLREAHVFRGSLALASCSSSLIWAGCIETQKDPSFRLGSRDRRPNGRQIVRRHMRHTYAQFRRAPCAPSSRQILKKIRSDSHARHLSRYLIVRILKKISSYSYVCHDI